MEYLIEFKFFIDSIYLKPSESDFTKTTCNRMSFSFEGIITCSSSLGRYLLNLLVSREALISPTSAQPTGGGSAAQHNVLTQAFHPQDFRAPTQRTIMLVYQRLHVDSTMYCIVKLFVLEISNSLRCYVKQSDALRKICFRNSNRR